MVDKTLVTEFEEALEVLFSYPGTPTGRGDVQDEYFKLATHHLRRWSLQYFQGMSEKTISLENLAEHLAERERARDKTRSAEQTADHERRIAISLYHVHIPKLQESGVVDFDARSRMIRYLDGPFGDNRLESFATSR